MNAGRPALVENPVNIGGHVTLETALFFRLRKPVGDKQVFLRLRLNQTIFPGSKQGNKSTPCQVTRFFHIFHIITSPLTVTWSGCSRYTYF
jgi:hypothetical protein